MPFPDESILFVQSPRHPRDSATSAFAPNFLGALMRKSFIVVMLVAGACTKPATSPAPAPSSYETVITGGRIVDGTGNPWFYGDVGIVGDRIVSVTPAGMLRNARANNRIDARGLVVAPGVIDIQAHSQEELLTGDSRVVGMITQGVTTMIM